MSDDEPGSSFRPSVDGEHRVGARIGKAIVAPFKLFFLNILLLVTRFLPFTTRFWRGLINAGYKGLVSTHKGATHVAHINRGGRLVHEPATYKHEADGPLDEPRWVTASGEWFHAPNKGSDVAHVNKTPTIWASINANDLGSWIQAEVAEVLDMGEDAPLMTDAEVTINYFEQDLMEGANPGGQAMADGGAELVEHVSVDHPGHLKDKLVPLDTIDDRFSGRVVSMDKYYETYPATTDPEKMEEQKLAGRLMEKDPEADRSFIIKVMLIAAAIALGGIALVTVVPMLLGGGGGGVGGAVLGLVPLLTTRRW